MIGRYPWNIFDSDAFPFVKQGAAGEWSGAQGWRCTGEPLPGEKVAAAEIIPEKTSIVGISPNPFNQRTEIRFELRDASQIRLTVYDISGREVAVLAEGFYSAGAHLVVFDGEGLSSGVYFARLQVVDEAQTKKLLLVK